MDNDLVKTFPLDKRVTTFIRNLPTEIDSSGHWRRWAIAKCPYCGKEFKLLKQNIGKVRSCGCSTGRLRSQTRHGYTSRSRKSRPYQIWADMRNRCNNKANARYHRYGGRGIAIAKVWDDFGEFVRWASSNGYTSSMTIDRVDNDGDYTPQNCRWVTIQENIQNRPRKGMVP